MPFEKAVTPPSMFRAEIRPEIEQVVTKALEKDRSTRYASAQEFLGDIAAVETAAANAGVSSEAMHPDDGRDGWLRRFEIERLEMWGGHGRRVSRLWTARGNTPR